MLGDALVKLALIWRARASYDCHADIGIYYIIAVPREPYRTTDNLKKKKYNIRFNNSLIIYLSQ